MFRRSTQPSPSPPCRSSLICVFICFFLSHFITLCLPDDVSLPPLRFIVIEEKCLQMFKQPNTDLHVHLAQYNTVSFSPLCKSLGVNRIFFFFFFYHKLRVPWKLEELRIISIRSSFKIWRILNFFDLVSTRTMIDIFFR